MAERIRFDELKLETLTETYKIKYWVETPEVAITKEGDILLFRDENQKPSHQHDIKDAIREMRHRTYQAMGRDIAITPEYIEHLKGESQSLNETIENLTASFSMLTSRVPPHAKEADMQRVHRIFNGEQKIRDEHKKNARSYIDQALQTRNNNEAANLIQLAIMELNERRSTTLINGLRAKLCWDSLVRIKTNADNTIQQSRLKLGEMITQINYKSITQAQIQKTLSELIKPSNLLDNLRKLDVNPFKKRIGMQEFKNLFKVSEAPNYETKEIQMILLKAVGELDHEIEKSLGSEGFDTFLTRLQPFNMIK